MRLPKTILFRLNSAAIARYRGSSEQMATWIPVLAVLAVVVVGSPFVVLGGGSITLIRRIETSAILAGAIFTLVTSVFLVGEYEDQKQARITRAWELLSRAQDRARTLICERRVAIHTLPSNTDCSNPPRLPKTLEEFHSASERAEVRRAMASNFGHMTAIQSLFDARVVTSGVDLRWFFLDGVAAKPNQDLRHADLIGASLRNAQLPTAILEGANLSAVNLTQANLSGANLWDADLAGAVLIGADLSNVRMRTTDLSGVTLGAKATLKGSRGWLIDLSDARIRDSDFSDVYFFHSDFSDSQILDTNFNGAILDHSNLAGAHICRSNLSGSSLRNADLSGAHFGGVDFSGADLEGAIISHAEFGMSPLDLCPGKPFGLTQAQLDQVDPASLAPNLSEIKDESTGTLLDWRGR